MRLRTLLLVGCLATAGAGCGFVRSAVEVNEEMQSEDPDERWLATLKGRFLLTLGGGTVGVLLLFLAIRWGLASLWPSAERTTELATERAAGSPLGVLTLAVVIPASGGEPPPLPRGGADVDQLLDLVGTLRAMRGRWRYVGARGTPAMDPHDSEAEATRLSGAYRSRVSVPPDHRGVNDGWLALVTVRAPGDFSRVMPSDAAGFEASLAPLFELGSNDSLAFTAEWIPVGVAASLSERLPALVRVA